MTTLFRSTEDDTGWILTVDDEDHDGSLIFRIEIPGEDTWLAFGAHPDDIVQLADILHRHHTTH